MTSQEQADSNMPSSLSRGTVRLIGQDGKISDRKFPSMQRRISPFFSLLFSGILKAVKGMDDVILQNKNR